MECLQFISRVKTFRKTASELTSFYMIAPLALNVLYILSTLQMLRLVTIKLMENSG